MIRRQFRRLGLQSMVEGNDVLVPPEQALEIRDDVGDAIPKIDDGPWPAFPADLTSIALALATQAEGTILIFEKMFENRLFFVDKLVAMGARITLCDPHRAIVSGPSRLHGERAREPRHPRRDGDAHRRPGRRGHLGDRQRRPDRPRLRAHRPAACATSAPTSSASPRTKSLHNRRGFGPQARATKVAMTDLHPIPRDQGHPARRDARAARARARPLPGLRGARLRPGRDAGDRVRRGARPRRRARVLGRLPLLRRARRPAGDAHRHDDPDRPARLDPLRRPPSRRFASSTSAAPTGRCAPSAARCASSCRPGSS